MSTDPTTGWRADHANFSKLLDVFERELQVFDQGERPDYELMLDILTYLQHFPKRTHHPREDAAFEILTRYDKSLEPIVTRFLQEHRVIAAAGDTLLELLEEILEDAFVERAQVESAAATFLVYYRHHISGEDDIIIPIAAKLLQPDDWKTVREAISSEPDPLFGSAVDKRYKELRERIEAAAGA